MLGADILLLNVLRKRVGSGLLAEQIFFQNDATKNLFRFETMSSIAVVSVRDETKQCPTQCCHQATQMFMQCFVKFSTVIKKKNVSL